MTAVRASKTLKPTPLKQTDYTAAVGELVLFNCVGIYNGATLTLPTDPPVGSLVGALIYIGDESASLVTWTPGSGNTILGSGSYDQTGLWNLTVMLFNRSMGLPDWILYSA